MADNVSITQGSGTVIATDEVGGFQYQRIKIGLGADGTGVDAIGGIGKATTASQRVAIADIGSGEYELVAASATTQILGLTGGAGDFLMGLLIIPATTSPGAVAIKDGALTAITVFTGGATSVSNLVPFMVPLGIYSVNGAWQVTTGTNVSAIAIGDFLT